MCEQNEDIDNILLWAYKKYFSLFNTGQELANS